jgi:putative ABC transport system permease protein
MLLFKVIMGLITGISVLVGGVGVMNVLLITVTERTREIGVRKAVGARRRDVVAQFLAEAVAVSGVGSLIGLGLGLAVVFAAAPVLRAATDVPFYAAVTPQTLAVVAAVAVAVGVVFGTYPALRAARLRPADAIRHE